MFSFAICHSTLKIPINDLLKISSESILTFMGYPFKSFSEENNMSEGIRIDKWLWAVRIFKSRSQATDACKSGKVKIDAITVKPSREVKLNEEIFVQIKHITKTLKVIGLLNNRVAAKLVADYMEDLTPPEEYEKEKLKKEINYEFRDRGLGRPTKKERRLIDRLKKSKF